MKLEQLEKANLIQRDLFYSQERARHAKEVLDSLDAEYTGIFSITIGGKSLYISDKQALIKLVENELQLCESGVKMYQKEFDEL